ncbi:MAG: arginine--tRNA ligase [Clostridia bacterium]|nr:arginine--tRNA ligase [Clostridia bacterium]
MDARNDIIELLAHLTGLPEEQLNPALEIPPAGMGDYALPCFKLSKAMRKAPPAIAADIAGRAAAEGNLPPSLDRIEAIGGYVNFFLRQGAYTAGVVRSALEAGPNLGCSDEGRGKPVVLEYSSPNIAKPFHVGHAFTTVIGHSLSRIYAHLGYPVIRMNHLGDYGTQFGKLISAYLRWGDEAALEAAPIDELFRIYVKFHKEAEEHPELEDEGRMYFRRLEEGSEREVSIWQRFKDLSLREFERLYRRLGVTFDNYNGESFYSDQIPAVVDMLREKGLLEESQGAMVVRLDEEGMPPCIVLKSDGTTIYASRDIAAALYRMREFHFHKNIYVVGTPQALHFRQVFAVLRKAGFVFADDCVHIGFGLLRFADAKFSTREGNVILLEDLLDQAVAKTYEIIVRNSEQRGTGMDDAEMRAIAEKVGIGAVIYTYLRNGRERDIVFSWEDMLDFEGDTAPYVMYTYARIRSILRKALEAGTDPAGVSDAQLLRLDLPEEFEIARQLDGFGDAVRRAAAEYEPFQLTRQIGGLARLFNKYYNQYSILSAGDPDLVTARLALCEAVSSAIRTGTWLLGIEVAERM